MLALLNNRFGYSKKLNPLCCVTSMEFSETVTVKIYENTPKKNIMKRTNLQNTTLSVKTINLQ